MSQSWAVPEVSSHSSSSPDALGIPEVTSSTDAFKLKAHLKFHDKVRPNGSVKSKLKVKASEDTPEALEDAAFSDLKALVNRVLDALL